MKEQILKEICKCRVCTKALALSMIAPLRGTPSSETVERHNEQRKNEFFEFMNKNIKHFETCPNGKYFQLTKYKLKTRYQILRGI